MPNINLLIDIEIVLSELVEYCFMAIKYDENNIWPRHNCASFMKFIPICWGYQMSVGLVLKLLNELTKSILICKPLASRILLYTMSSIFLVMNLHKFKFYLSHRPLPWKRTLKNNNF